MKIPLPKTLKKYGLTEQDWIMIYHNQGGCCAICGNSLKDKRANIDHFHRQGWKKIPDEKRKQDIRGLLCWTCNKLIVGRGVNLKRLYKAVEYLEAFEKRKDDQMENIQRRCR